MANASDLDEVRAVLERGKQELIETLGAEGVAVGAGPDGKGYAIVVFVAEQGKRRHDIESLEGIPIRLEVTGRFKPLVEGD